MLRGSGHVRISARRAAGLLVAVMLGVSLSSAPAAAAPTACQPNTPGCVDVTPDIKDAAFVGTGGLLIPADSFTGTASDRSDAATCPDCEWALVPVCKRGGPGTVGCGPAATSCPAGSRRMVVLLLRPPSTVWSNVGSMCVSGGPLTVDDVAQRLSDVVIEQVPDLRPSFQPPGGTVVNLPTVFASGQPRGLGTRTFSLVGFAVVLDARATWRWDFGDGQTLVTDEPGGAWPNVSVAHTYTRAGRLLARVTSEWQGWFTVDGLGPFPVAGPAVTQASGPLPVLVHEARAVLVAD